MIRIISIILFSLLLLLTSVSCHKNVYDNDDIYATKKRKTEFKEQPKSDTRETRKSSSSFTIDDAWRNLDVKLSRNDNKALYEELKSWLGTPYKYASMEKGVGTDCSGMVMQVYLKVYKQKLDRNSARQFTHNCKKISRDNLLEGDLVFFNNGKGSISHVGIYLKDGYFVHASSSRGVMVNNLSQRYYDAHFHCAGRVIK